jgi:phosphatidylinositol dimannoside acyltransferase
MHFGAIEIPALWASRHGQRITAPMETIDDPHLQRYFHESRSRTGLNVIPLSGAAARLRSELADGRAVALVADRPVGGTGFAVELFGAPTRLPAGPAVLALETGAPAWVVATRRVGYGDYRARMERIDLPPEGSRRERVNAFMAAQARAFERAVADAPEQWWTTFFPIWSDARGR